MENQVPNGSLRFDVDPSYLKTNPFFGATQTISLRSVHNNNGGDDPHHSSQLGGTLHVALSEATLYVCAFSQEDANQLAWDAYGIIELPENFYVVITKPTSAGTVDVKENGSINIQADVSDTAPIYTNFYKVEAEVEYLDVLFTPTEKFMLFDDGVDEHEDLDRNDGLFNALWVPKHGGNIQLTVTAKMPDGRVQTDVTTFEIEELPDLAVTRVYLEEVSLTNNTAEVVAEITNLGFTYFGPDVSVVFRYYATDRNGNKVGDAIYTSNPMHLIPASLLTPWERGQMKQVIDDQFTPAALSSYFVEVEVDPDP